MTVFGFSSEYVALFGLGVLFIVGFAFWERYAKEPLIQAWILRERILISSILAASFQ
jgi:hypothetical protein